MDGILIYTHNAYIELILILNLPYVLPMRKSLELRLQRVTGK